MQAYDHRANARAALGGNWFPAILVSLVAGIIGGTSGGFNFNVNFNLDSGSVEHAASSVPPEIGGLLAGILGTTLVLTGTAGLLLSIVRLALGGVIQLGEAQYNLNLIDRRGSTFGDLFSQFDRFGEALVMNLLSSLYVALWSLLFVIPGIIASYSYAMAPYILLEDPYCSGSEALRRSKAMMDGHKGELFWLDLTFFGWELLATLTLGIGNLWLAPYKKASRASFYRDLQNQGYVTVE